MDRSRQERNRKNRCGLDNGGEARTLEGSPIAGNGGEGSAPGEVSGDGGPAGQSQTSGDERYRDILWGGKAFLCPDLGNESLTMEALRKAVTEDDSVAVSVPQYTVLDLDGDGEEEAVLWLRINGNTDYGFEVLHNRGGEVYGYTLQYRELIDLKGDGTFTFSSGAADSGVGRLTFSDSGYGIEKLIYSQSGFDADNKIAVQYFAEGKPCGEETFFDALDAQGQKPDAQWQPFSADGGEN